MINNLHINCTGQVVSLLFGEELCKHTTSMDLLKVMKVTNAVQRNWSKRCPKNPSLIVMTVHW